MGREKSHSSICLLWMAIMNVYRDLLRVNPFLKGFSYAQNDRNVCFGLEFKVFTIIYI